MLEVVPGDALALVGDRENNALAAALPAGNDPDPLLIAAQGLAGVGDQVDEDLFEMDGIAVKFGQIRGAVEFEALGAALDESAQDLHRGLHRQVDIYLTEDMIAGLAGKILEMLDDAFDADGSFGDPLVEIAEAVAGGGVGHAGDGKVAVGL